jgi:hypothetical protein
MGVADKLDALSEAIGTSALSIDRRGQMMYKTR